MEDIVLLTLREKFPNAKFFRFVFSHIWTEYGDLRSTAIYGLNLRIQSKYGKIRTRKNSVVG